MNNSTTRKNPYIIGRPIYEPEKFFGRERLFLFIEDNLNSNTKILLLHGQRRIGTSSVLQQIPHKVAQDKFAFVIFDLQGHSQSSVSDILHNLSEAIAESLAELNSDIVTPPSEEQLQNNQNIFSDDFLPRVYQRLGDKNLVLLLDEFDVISSDDNISNQDNNFFKYLQLLLKQQQKLFIIPAVRGSKDNLQKLLDLFKKPPSQKVDLLDQLSARRLITEPAQNMLEYEEDAIKAILELSSAHPYFTQAICFNLFLQAKIEEKWKISRSDVEGIVDKTIESVTGGLAWFWDGLSLNEKVVFSAVAEAQKIAIKQGKLFPEDWLMLVKNYEVIPTGDLIKAGKDLTINTFLDDTERRVKIELVRRWLVERHPLQKTIWKLEELKKEEINTINEEATKLHQDGKNQDAIDCYEEILNLNPNHFSTLPILADRYLEIDNFDKALKLYQRAYKIDYIRNKEGFLLALEAYGNDLIKQPDFIKAKIQFEEVLKIEPDRDSAKYKLREVEAEIEQQKKLNRKVEIYKQELEIKQLTPEKTPVRQGVIWGIIAAVIALVGVSIELFSLRMAHLPITSSTPSPTPNDNIQSNISRGDRTLFFTIPNPSRDQGIEAFKNKNYLEAENYFKKGFRYKNNSPDPEVLIYQNNARAIQQGNPLTLAVVVPADNALSTAQEILRGVAQSQNQFNVNGGLNGRLLEITIANDANNLKQAKQIAEQLVKDKSLLGVIGHTTSDATQAALDIYKQAPIPIISPTSGSNDLKGNVFFRVLPSNAVSSDKLAKYAANQSLNKVVTFYNPKSEYSDSFNQEFQINFNKRKGQIIRQIDLTDPKLNIEKELKDSASQQVQAVMLFPDVDYTATAIGIAKVNANKDNPLRLKLLGGSTLYDEKTLQNGGNNIKDLVITVPWFEQLPQAKNFSNAANKLWKEGISWRTATSYDATQAFLKAIKASFPNVSRETILQKLPEVNLSPKETSGDILKFKNGERQIEPILIQVIENGKFRILK